MKTRGQMLLGLSALVFGALPFGCSRFSSCEDTLCGSGGSLGGAASGGASSGGSSLGGGGASSGGSGGTVDPCDACEGETPLCNSSKECVECLKTTDCKSAAKSICDTATGTCNKCSSNEDCAHIDGKNVCDAGTCVECTIATESAKCGANSCNPATKSCTGTPVGSVNVCEGCVADSECEVGYACVPMKFAGADRDGGYCLKQTPGCAGPYGVPTPERASLSGAAEVKYCGINELVTTCEAVLDLVAGKECAADDECGAASIDDGRCETVNSGVTTTCTISCSVAGECPSGAACSGPSDSKYCGGP